MQECSGLLEIDISHDRRGPLPFTHSQVNQIAFVQCAPGRRLIDQAPPDRLLEFVLIEPHRWSIDRLPQV